MTWIFDASGRPVSSMAASPRSTKCIEFGATGGAAIGIWVIHGWRSSMSRWMTAQARSRDRQPSPSITRSSAPSALAFHMSWSSSSLFATYRYSAIVVTPSSAATRAMETASRPSASASRMAAAAMASADSPGRGPRLPRSRRPQSRSSPGGSGRGWPVPASPRPCALLKTKPCRLERVRLTLMPRSTLLNWSAFAAPIPFPAPAFADHVRRPGAGRPVPPLT